MSTLLAAKDWNRARALKLHEHFLAIRVAVLGGAKIGHELARAARLLDGIEVPMREGGSFLLEASAVTLRKEWDHWNRGGRKGRENDANIRRPEALLCAYKAGCGGHEKVPRALVAELQRRCTLVTGGRDKHGKSPIQAAINSIKRDYQLQRPLPGIDYTTVPVGAEFPWHDRTMLRHKPSLGLRALGNRGAAAHKAVAAYVSMNYRELRKGELYTLDDVELDIVCLHETGIAVRAVCYILMEVGSRAIVAYVMKPCTPDAPESDRRKAITEEDVAELLAYGLQAPGFGIGVGYTTHLLFERGTTACSEAAERMLEGMTNGGIKVHRTGMVGGIRWEGSARDKAIGNSSGKGVIESFNRRLHYALLHLPGQKGNDYGNQPQNLGETGKARYRFDGNADARNRRQNKGTSIDEAEQLAQLNIATGGRMILRLPHLYFGELERCVQAAIDQHNREAGHAYRGHGTFEQVQVERGVWEDREKVGTRKAEGGENELPESRRPSQEAATALELSSNPGCVPPAAGASKRSYKLAPSSASGSAIGKQERAIYWSAWSKLARKRPELDRHAVTRSVLGCVVSHKDLTRPQWAQLLKAFRELAFKS